MSVNHGRVLAGKDNTAKPFPMVWSFIENARPAHAASRNTCASRAYGEVHESAAIMGMTGNPSQSRWCSCLRF